MEAGDHTDAAQCPFSDAFILVQTGDPLIAELLVQCGANVDAADVFRRTPLHYAILYGYPQASMAGEGCTRQ